MITLTKTRLAAIAMAAFASTAVTTGPAAASGGDPGVTAQGACSTTSDWTLQVKPRDAGLEVEFEVDSNVVGQRWQIQLTDNGTSFFKGTRTTTAPSGSFDLNARTANRAGADRVVARAVNPATGETCTGRVTLP